MFPPSTQRIRTNPTPSVAETTTTIPAGTVSKRKRAPLTPAKPSTSAIEEKPPDNTPNPKPRKQRSIAKNPNADFIPALVLSADSGQDVEKISNASVRRVVLSARGSRRSATPIPPYEPPPDIFTPPREVFMSPAPTKSAPKRKGSVGRQTKARTKGKELRVITNVQVKQELPDDIDLLAPMPPPSPTDDPLLLSGPPELEPWSELQDGETSSRPAGECNRSSSVLVQTAEDKQDLPPSSPVAPSDADVDVMLFNFDVGGADDGWSDSDDDTTRKGNDEEEGEGDFTGKWKMFTVRTKQDPPSTATRTRQELWGRPISPFPKIKQLALLREEEEEEEVRRLSIEPESDEEPQSRELPITTEAGTNSQGGYVPASKESQDDDSSDTADEPSLVKITSADPWAAARAVAFLQQHDYDCYTKFSKKRRASQSPVVDLAKESRRRDVTSSGILKAAGRRRRRSTMSSPKTPVPVRFINKEEGSITIPKQYPAGTREWAKDDWKLLDACFTDQRINTRDSLDMLAPVDGVELEDVVARFIDLIGGQPLVDTFGESWTRDNLFERTRALVKKQRSGSVAPPTTPISSFSFASPLNFDRNTTNFLCSTMDVPDFTPIHPGLTSDKSIWHRSIQPTSVVDDSLFYERRQGGLPPTILAPRYSHLLEEAISDAVPSSDHPEDIPTHGEDQTSDLFDCSPDFTETNIKQASWNQGLCSVDQDLSPQRLDSVPVTNNLSNRFKGFLSSYLPMLSKSLPSKKPRVQGHPGLPLPPPSVLEKPRGPVETPVRPVVPRAPHPKELVHLNHISLKPSNIPRAKPVPKRLVQLVPVPHTTIKPETASRERMMPRPRRSSGSSVKDLVRGFEQMEKSVDSRFGGVGNMKGKLALKPVWKP